MRLDRGMTGRRVSILGEDEGGNLMLNIVVPVDFRRGTAHLVEEATHMARHRKGRLVLLHVTQPPRLAPPNADEEVVEEARRIGLLRTREEVARELHADRRRIQSMARRLRDAGVDARAVTCEDLPTYGILHEAERFHADMIIMGSHGFHRHHDPVTWRVSDWVSEKAPCPVMVVPDEDA